MKKIIFLFSLLFSLNGVAQLQTNVYAFQHLASASKQGWVQGNCYSWQVGFSSNLFPYATGMNIYLKIDSIPGPCDSTKIYCSPTYNYVYKHAGDSMLITAGINDMYFYYLSTYTIYLSLNASGTPQISSEPYFCFHSVETAFFADGCSSIYNEFAGGAGPLDNNKGCSVDGPLFVSSTAASEMLQPFPNPSNGKFMLAEKGVVTIRDAQGRTVACFQHEKNAEIDLSFLQSGIYFLQLENEAGIKTFRLNFVRE